MKRGFDGIEEFLHAKEKDHLRSNSSMKERYEELDRCCGELKLEHWEFVKGDINKSNELSNEPYTVHEILSEASLSYILGLFDSCTVLSSIATEKMARFILELNNDLRPTKVHNGFDPSKDVFKVKTVNGIVHYGYCKGRLNKFYADSNDNWFKVSLLSLWEMINRVKNHGYDTSEIDETIGGSGPNLFVLRRDTTVHANFTSLGLGQQVYDIHQKKTIDAQKFADYFVRHKDIAIDQFTRAFKFVQKSFEQFNLLYGYH